MPDTGTSGELRSRELHVRSSSTGQEREGCKGTRHGGIAYLHRSGSVHAPLWSAQCLGCGHTTRHHRLISVVMAALDLHCTMQNLQVDEARATQGRAVNADRRAAYHQLRDNGQSTYKAAIVLGIKRDTGLRWDKERRDTFDNNRQEASA